MSCWCHTRRYIDVVKRFYDPFGFPALGIGDGGDCPPFAEMHAASAAVAGGSIRAIEAILRGDVEHAQHPGGGCITRCRSEPLLLHLRRPGAGDRPGAAGRAASAVHRP